MLVDQYNIAEKLPYQTAAQLVSTIAKRFGVVCYVAANGNNSYVIAPDVATARNIRAIMRLQLDSLDLRKES